MSCFRWLVRWAIAVFLLLQIGCGAVSEREASGDGLRVVATVGMVGDLVRAVLGDRGEVKVLMGTGIDPHTYKVSRGDVLKLSRSALIFSNGLKLEGKMGEVLSALGRQGTRVEALGDWLKGHAELLADTGHGLDPHIWMDVGLWKNLLERIVVVLSEMDPQGAAVYAANAAAFGEQLLELDGYIRQIVETVPEGRRLLVTAHDAFGYFGRAYGVEVRGIQGLSTESEAGLRDIEKLVQLIVDRGVGAVFAESTVANKNVRALVEGARARGHLLSIGGELFSDAMGVEGSYEGTYLGMMDHNATTIVRALGGQAPAGGWRGRLAGAGPGPAEGKAVSE